MAEPVAVELTRIFAADQERVFSAWTDPKQLSQWFRPSDQMTVEAQAEAAVGGKYRFRMVGPDGVEHVSFGEYREVDPPDKLVFTWAWESGSVTDSLVTISLRTVEGGTELTLRHEKLATAELREHHTQGWNGCLAQLEGLLAD